MNQGEKGSDCSIAVDRAKAWLTHGRLWCKTCLEASGIMQDIVNHESAWAAKLAAAEARIRGLEEDLRVVSDVLLRMRKKRPDGSVVGTTWPLREAELDQFFAALRVAEAALAPPPEAAKRGKG